MYLIAEGDLPVCICAHMDTVFLKPPHTFYYDQEKTVLWSPQGLGADDRAASYAIIELLEKGYRPSIILSDLEERGGIGAEALVKKYPKCPFQDCRALIQLDRQGANEAVYYECDNKDFEKLITSYDFSTKYGTFTDISIYAPQWGIAAVNLSVGYYDEHHQTEILNMTELHQTIDKVERMLKDCREWLSYIYIPHIHKKGWGRQDRCICCGKPVTPETSYYCNSTEDRVNDLLMCDKCYSFYFNDTY